MKQYKQLLSDILQYGTVKPSARANMPGSISLFGHQSRYDLAQGFPAVTTKKLAFKQVVTELRWFLQADDNIKFMVDNGCNIWNQDAYGYYLKLCKKQNLDRHLSLREFEYVIKMAKSQLRLGEDSAANSHVECPLTPMNYCLGDTGQQYPLLWRQWENTEVAGTSYDTKRGGSVNYTHKLIDQISNVLQSLRTTPESRRHIVTAWNPATVDDMALPACHCLFQFNCRPIEYFEGDGIAYGKVGKFYRWVTLPSPFNRFEFEPVEANSMEEVVSKHPQYHLDLQLYQRSGDSFLGIPFNIASYALLIHIFAKMCNMVPGHFIHTIGDAHIYENHLPQVQKLLTREPLPLPQLQIDSALDWTKMSLDEVLALGDIYQLTNYQSHPAIKAELKTGL